MAKIRTMYVQLEIRLPEEGVDRYTDFVVNEIAERSGTSHYDEYFIAGELLKQGVVVAHEMIGLDEGEWDGDD